MVTSSPGPDSDLSVSAAGVQEDGAKVRWSMSLAFRLAFPHNDSRSSFPSSAPVPAAASLPRGEWSSREQKEAPSDGVSRTNAIGAVTWSSLMCVGLSRGVF